MSQKVSDFELEGFISKTSDVQHCQVLFTMTNSAQCLLAKVQGCAGLRQGDAHLCKTDETIATHYHILHWGQFNNTLHVSVL